jgi:hypothetical protein
MPAAPLMSPLFDIFSSSTFQIPLGYLLFTYLIYLLLMKQSAIAITERSFQNLACKKWLRFGCICNVFRSGAEFNGEEKPGK